MNALIHPNVSFQSMIIILIGKSQMKIIVVMIATNTSANAMLVTPNENNI